MSHIIVLSTQGGSGISIYTLTYLMFQNSSGTRIKRKFVVVCAFFSRAVNALIDFNSNITPKSFSIFFFNSLKMALSMLCSLMIICWERADFLSLMYVMFLVYLSLSHVVSLVRCGT